MKDTHCWEVTLFTISSLSTNVSPTNESLAVWTIIRVLSTKLTEASPNSVVAAPTWT